MTLRTDWGINSEVSKPWLHVSSKFDDKSDRLHGFEVNEVYPEKLKTWRQVRSEGFYKIFKNNATNKKVLFDLFHDAKQLDLLDNIFQFSTVDPYDQKPILSWELVEEFFNETELTILAETIFNRPLTQLRAEYNERKTTLMIEWKRLYLIKLAKNPNYTKEINAQKCMVEIADQLRETKDVPVEEAKRIQAQIEKIILDNPGKFVSLIAFINKLMGEEKFPFNLANPYARRLLQVVLPSFQGVSEKFMLEMSSEVVLPLFQDWAIAKLKAVFSDRRQYNLERLIQLKDICLASLFDLIEHPAAKTATLDEIMGNLKNFSWVTSDIIKRLLIPENIEKLRDMTYAISILGSMLTPDYLFLFLEKPKQSNSIANCIRDLKTRNLLNDSNVRKLLVHNPCDSLATIIHLLLLNDLLSQRTFDRVLKASDYYVELAKKISGESSLTLSTFYRITDSMIGKLMEEEPSETPVTVEEKESMRTEWGKRLAPLKSIDDNIQSAPFILLTLLKNEVTDTEGSFNLIHDLYRLSGADFLTAFRDNGSLWEFISQKREAELAEKISHLTKLSIADLTTESERKKAVKKECENVGKQIFLLINTDNSTAITAILLKAKALGLNLNQLYHGRFDPLLCLLDSNELPPAVYMRNFNLLIEHGYQIDNLRKAVEILNIKSVQFQPALAENILEVISSSLISITPENHAEILTTLLGRITTELKECDPFGRYAGYKATLDLFLSRLPKLFMQKIDMGYYLSIQIPEPHLSTFYTLFEQLSTSSTFSRECREKMQALLRSKKLLSAPIERKAGSGSDYKLFGFSARGDFSDSKEGAGKLPVPAKKI